MFNRVLTFVKIHTLDDKEFVILELSFYPYKILNLFCVFLDLNEKMNICRLIIKAREIM